MKTSVKLLSAAALVAFLGACGNSTAERGVTGAGIGAGTGALVGAVSGMSIGTGALIGAGVGAAVGALTDKDTLNLGDPVWED
ncbi:MAG: hypothetical protein IT230_04770 [Flavobacteriales bacterium]|nr:hypothetical protein [Flavobacteriales bacterium]